MNTQTLVWNIQGTDGKIIRLQMIRGNTQNIFVEVIKSDGTPYDLSGCTIWFVVKKYVTSITKFISKKSPTTISIIDASMGLFKLTIASSETVNVSPWNCQYYFSFQLQNSDSVLMTPLFGTLDILNDVTTTQD